MSTMMTAGGGVLRHLAVPTYVLADGETCLERTRRTGTITKPRRRPYSGPVAKAWLFSVRMAWTADKPEAGQRRRSEASNGRVKVAALTVNT